ncbi:hypothetical protein FJZ31_15965 [Candidatus Poribacteria bacterium]|nr:hypothetical protein [Candidatus Poribacteria bacterium]
MRLSKSNIFIIAIVTLAIAVATIATLRIDRTGKKGSGLGEAFTYDLNDLRKTDPALIQYEEAGKIKTGFQDVFSIAAGPNKQIYVAGDKAIRVFDGDGNRLSEIKLTDSPRCLAVTGGGIIYVGMKEHVEVYDHEGVRKANWESLGQNAVLTSIAASENDVFLADAGNRVVLRYDTSGKLVNRIGEKNEDKNIPGFVVPSPYFDLAVAPDGLLRVVNPGRHKIEAYTFDGYLELSWGETSTNIKGFSGCCNPVNFAMLADGGFVTCEKGLPRVKIYDADGVFVGVVAGSELFAEHGKACPPDGFSNCQTGGLDVAVDSRARILILDPDERTVRIFTRIKSS